MVINSCCLQDAGQVTRLGDELHKLFALHNQVYNLALEGSKSGAKKSKKKGSTAAADPADDGTEQQVRPWQLNGQLLYYPPHENE